MYAAGHHCDGTAPRWWCGGVFIGIVAGATIEGVAVRRWAFGYTRPVRFLWDIQRNYRYGTRGVRAGYLNVYENVDQERPDGNFELNYSPLRLLLFTRWVAWTNRQFPDEESWRSD